MRYLLILLFLSACGGDPTPVKVIAQPVVAPAVLPEAVIETVQPPTLAPIPLASSVPRSSPRVITKAPPMTPQVFPMQPTTEQRERMGLTSNPKDLY